MLVLAIPRLRSIAMKQRVVLSHSKVDPAYLVKKVGCFIFVGPVCARDGRKFQLTILYSIAWLSHEKYHPVLKQLCYLIERCQCTLW